MNEFFSGREIFFCAGALYFVAFALGFFAFLQKKDVSPRLVFAASCVLTCGWLTQFVGLYLRGFEAGTVPLRNTFELLQTLGWSAIVATGILRVVWAMRVPALLASGLALGLSGLGLANAPAWDVFPALAEKNPWVGAHAVLAIVGYAFWTASALVWLAYILQDRALRKRSANRFYAMLPDLASLDRVAGRLVAGGIVALVASIAVRALNLFGENVLAPAFVGYKILISAILIFGNARLIFLRRKKTITGRSFARRGLALFVLGVILLGGLTCVRNATMHADTAPAAETEGSGDGV